MERKRTVLYALIIYIALIVTCLPANAAKQNEKRNYFDKWRNVSTKELMKRAYDIINNDGDIDSAFIFYNVVYSRYVEDPDDEEKGQSAASALNDMGYLMCFHYFDYERAYTYLSQSLELSDKFHDEANKPYVYVNMGNLILTQRAYVNPAGAKDALPYYKQGFYIAARLKDWDIMLINFSNLLGMTNSLDSLIDYKSIGKEVDYFEKLKVPNGTKMLPYIRKEVLVYKAIANHKYEDALALCEQTIKCIPDNPDSLRYVLNTRAEQAACLMKLGHYQEAFNILDQQLDLAKREGIKDLESEIYLDLMIVSREMGNEQQAEHYEYLYLKSKDDMLFGSHKIANVEQVRLMQQLSKANEEVEEGVRHRHHIMAVAIVALVFLVIIGGFSIILFRKNRRLRDSNHHLYLQVQDDMKKEDKGTSTTENSQKSAEPKYKNSNLDDERRNDIVKRIESVLTNKEQLCSEDMSLNRLSEIIETPYKLVSQVINEHWQKNFSQLLSEYRIHEACRRMQNKDVYGNYTIEAIGTSVGFHTRSNFVTTFKRITGLTPSEYLKEVETHPNQLRPTPTN